MNVIAHNTHQRKAFGRTTDIRMPIDYPLVVIQYYVEHVRKIARRDRVICLKDTYSSIFAQRVDPPTRIQRL